MPDWLVDLSQVVGALGALIALVVAFYSIRRTNIAVVRERKTLHELEVLRDLALLDLYDFPNHIKPVKSFLRLLPREDLPLVRAALHEGADAAMYSAFTRRYPNAPMPEKRGPQGYDWNEDCFRYLIDDGTAIRELNEAIDRRLAALP